MLLTHPINLAKSRPLLSDQDVDGLVLNQAHDGADLVSLALQLVSSPHRPGRPGYDEPVKCQLAPFGIFGYPIGCRTGNGIEGAMGWPS